MSVLTDGDFLLHTLQLSYLRHVLPNHASLSAITASSTGAGGPTAYSLIAFPPPSDLATSNPYLALSGAADPHRWPELGANPSGRSSPPLAPLLARDAAPRRGGLQYSQTIGKGVASVGMKVDGGKPRTWKGKDRLSRAGTSEEPLDRGDQHSPPRVGLRPPPVIITSPSHTPRDLPAVRPAEPSAALSSSIPHRARFQDVTSSSSSVGTRGVGFASPDSPSDFPSRPLADTAGQSLASSGASLFGASAAGTPAPLQRRGSEMSSSSADSDFPAGPVQQVEPEPAKEIPVFQLPPGLRVRERRRVNIRPGEILAPAPVPAPPPLAEPSSLSSSADSDFAGRMPAQRAESQQPEAPAVHLPPGLRVRERRRVNIRPGQVLAPVAQPPPPPAADSLSSSPDSDFADRVPAPAPLGEQQQQPDVPTFQLPPGLRVRERRRVNIRPGGVVISTQASESEASLSTGTVNVSPHPHPHPPRTSEVSSSGASDFGGGLPSPLTPATPAPVATPLPRAESAQEAQAQGPPAFQLPPGIRLRERRRVNIRLGAVLAPAPGTTPEPAAPMPPMPAPAAPPVPEAPALRAPPSRRRSSRPASPSFDGPYFPSRASYLSPRAPSNLAASDGGVARRSALSALLAAQKAAASTSSRGLNPFSTLYAACVSRSTSAGDAVPLRLYFPRAAEPDRPVQVSVKRDVTVEEVLGVGLWAYWEEGREPPLDEINEEDAREGRETAKWALRIVEDGQVDEDFPALDRTRGISAFAFTEFAIVRAEDEQIEDNLAKQASIVRRPSRILASAISAVPATAPPTGNGSTLDPQICARGSSLAVPVLLKIALPPVTAAEGIKALVRGEQVGVQTTVQVPSDMYLADVLDLVVRKRGLRTPSRDWALVVRLLDGELVVPLDRTVESLSEQHELVLVPRAQVGPGGMRKVVGAGGGNQDPSQSIFTPSHLAAAAQPAYQSAAAAAATAAPYLHFSVLRKLPMSLGGRHARVIAIDGDYLHFMPPEGNLPALTRGRTTSFHISAVHSCKISRRSASSFKIVVHTKRGVDKRYDFEAESPERAREIVETVRRVMDFYRAERGGR